jgi:integrase
MSRAKRAGRFVIREVLAVERHRRRDPLTDQTTERIFKYATFRLSGWLDGRRIRKQFKSHEEALGEKNRLEVMAANAGEVTARVTRLSAAQLAEAEAAFVMLGGQSLQLAVQWFRDTYRPPTAAKALDEAGRDFLRDRAQHVRPVVLRNYRHTITALTAAFAGRSVHEISTSDIQGFLTRRAIGKKRFNNLRGDLHAFFAYCKVLPRTWVRENPVTPIPSFKLARGIPEILTAAKVAEIMTFVESFAGGPRVEAPAGFLAPYFSLCLFAGLRPSVGNGEIAKIAEAPDLAKTINLGLGVIRLSPEQSKVKSVRAVRIQPNLAAWLKRYPVDRFPIVPANARRLIDGIRKRFGIGHDVMRHTFISMHVAKFKSLGQAALEAGNSEAMIRRHYLDLVTDAEAEAFWSILPAR